MDIRKTFKELLGEVTEKQVFEFCYKYSMSNNLPLDWLAPCGFKQYYIAQCERIYCNILKTPELRNHQNIMKLTDFDMNEDLKSYKQNVTFVQKVYSSDHKCGRCGEKKISITKKQMRSADEGHTNVFTCDGCGYTRFEN